MSPFEEDRTYETDDARSGGATISADAIAALAGEHSTFLNRVYRYMALGLAATGLTAMWVSTNEEALRFALGNLWLLVIAEFVLVLALSAMATKLSKTAALTMFLAYATLSGLTLAPIFLVYAKGSIATTFFVTGGTFGAMSLWASRTKKDLTEWGSFLMMGLWGLIIAGVVNLFVRSPAIDWVASGVGVLVFVGLTAWDTQKISAMFFVAEDEKQRDGLAINGALMLYLDFVNLFLYLLRFLGKRR
jgi:FtsH-binding integral membrane protein